VPPAIVGDAEPVFDALGTLAAGIGAGAGDVAQAKP
jgi:hypothetical protein